MHSNPSKSTGGVGGIRVDGYLANNKHIVDVLIEERTTRLKSNPLWPLIKLVLYPVLGHGRAVEMADKIVGLSGRDALQYVQDLLQINVTISGLHNIPKKGAFILAPNHPTGIADGVAVYQALSTVREDIAIFTNRDAVRVSPRLNEVLIPVEWRDGYRTPAKMKDTLRATSRAFADEKAVVLFPSGRIAYWHKDHQQLTERPWQASIVSLARKHNVPIVPMHMSARNSGLFYLVSRFSNELRDMTVFYELLNKKGSQFDLSVGPAISPDDIAGDQQLVTERLQNHVVERMSVDPEAVFLNRMDG